MSERTKNKKNDKLIIPGIYKIENLVNGKVYIGQSRNISSRIKSHKKELKGKYHRNSHLQSAWNKYGEGNFSFDELMRCKINDLYYYENLWINHYESHDRSKGYNILMPSKDMESFVHSEASKQKMSEKCSK